MEPPIGAVGQHAEIALPSLVGALSDVSGQLHKRGIDHAGGPEVAFHFDDREAGLDIDTTSVSDL